NCVGVTTTDIAALRAASPAWVAEATASPLFIVNTLEDSVPYSQLADMIMHLDALGVTNYQALTLPGNGHSFDNWAPVKDQALAFLGDGFAGIPPPPPLPPPVPGALSQSLLNVSTRADAGLGEDVLVGGFIVSGDAAKRVVLRAIGPSLTQFGVSGALADPMITLYDSSGILIESNDNRLELPGIANPLLPSNPAESLLTAILPEGNYTAIVQGANGAAGIALVEVYDQAPGSSRVANISTRGSVPTAQDIIIAGFIIGGADPTPVIVRALGPSLAAQGVSGPLPDPVLELRDGNGNLLFTNDNWRSGQEQQIIDTTIPPTNDLEAAIVATLAPGSYTALVHDSQSRTGVALVEAYDLGTQ
ncbi:MAG: hypothetical protein ABJB49_10500, partial [Nitrospirota bacterium]